MAKNGLVTDYDDAGFPQVAAFTASVAFGALPLTVKASAGRLCTVIVTTAVATGAITIWDNASAGSGTPLLVVPIGAAIGTIYQVNLPALLGITVTGATATAGVLTIGYS
jgi:hypothetical protein